MECCNHPTRGTVECYDNGQLTWIQNGYDARYPECGPDPAPPEGLDRGCRWVSAARDEVICEGWFENGERCQWRGPLGEFIAFGRQNPCPLIDRPVGVMPPVNIFNQLNQGVGQQQPPQPNPWGNAFIWGVAGVPQPGGGQQPAPAPAPAPQPAPPPGGQPAGPVGQPMPVQPAPGGGFQAAPVGAPPPAGAVTPPPGPWTNPGGSVPQTGAFLPAGSFLPQGALLPDGRQVTAGQVGPGGMYLPPGTVLPGGVVLSDVETLAPTSSKLLKVGGGLGLLALVGIGIYGASI